MNELQQFETHMDRMEREAQAQRASLAMEQEKTKQAKIAAKKDSKETFLWATSMVLIFATVVFLFGLWYVSVRGPSAAEELRQQEISWCYEKGGTWVPTQGDYREDDYISEHCSLANVE